MPCGLVVSSVSPEPVLSVALKRTPKVVKSCPEINESIRMSERIPCLMIHGMEWFQQPPGGGSRCNTRARSGSGAIIAYL